MLEKAENKECGTTADKILNTLAAGQTMQKCKNYVFKLKTKSSMYSRGAARYLAKFMGESSFYDIVIISLFNRKINNIS